MSPSAQRVVLVTGATDGIGRHTAVELARLGFRVLVHGRSASRVEAAVAHVVASAPGAEVQGVLGDLQSVAGARALAAQVAGVTPRLDVLLNNAGVFMKTFEKSPDGVEMGFAVCHLGHFALTAALLPLLAKAGHARVVNVSSVAHTRGQLDVASLRDASRFSGHGAYAQSKLCNVLFSVEFARRFPAARITANALHPGVVTTKLLKTGFAMAGPDSVSEGSRTSVFLASDPSVAEVSGRYFVRSATAEPNPLATDKALGAALWAESEKLCGAPFPSLG